MKTIKINGQQGDVLLKRIDKLPEGKVKVISKGKLILAEGESTGHFHGIDEKDSQLLDVGGVMVLDLKKTAKINHQEHKPFNVEPGLWQIGIVQEYDYFAQMKRKVVD